MLSQTYTYASGASGSVIRQTDYVYVDGRLSEVREADNDGPFTVDAPAGWVVTTYGYDDYGRMITKTVQLRHDLRI
jgi:YD repeat-containing protein